MENGTDGQSTPSVPFRVLKYTTMVFGNEFFYAPKQNMIEEHGVKAWAEFMVDFRRQHVSGLTVEENEEKVIMKINPCGSGGHLVNHRWYDGSAGHCLLKKGLPHASWGKKDMPV